MRNGAIIIDKTMDNIPYIEPLNCAKENGSSNIPEKYITNMISIIINTIKHNNTRCVSSIIYWLFIFIIN